MAQQTTLGVMATPAMIPSFTAKEAASVFQSYTVLASVKALLEADATMLALATGGIYDLNETGRLGVNRTTTPAVFDSNGIVQPFVLIKSRGAVFDGNLADDAEQIRTVQETITLWFYQDRGAEIINAMRTRAYELLHAIQVSPSFEVYWSGDIRQRRDDVLDANYDQSDFLAHVERT